MNKVSPLYKVGDKVELGDGLLIGMIQGVRVNEDESFSYWFNGNYHRESDIHLWKLNQSDVVKKVVAFSEKLRACLMSENDHLSGGVTTVRSMLEFNGIRTNRACAWDAIEKDGHTFIVFFQERRKHAKRN